MVFALWSSPNRIPIKYRVLSKKVSHLRPIYLRACNVKRSDHIMCTHHTNRKVRHLCLIFVSLSHFLIFKGVKDPDCVGSLYKIRRLSGAFLRNFVQCVLFNLEQKLWDILIVCQYREANCALGTVEVCGNFALFLFLQGRFSDVWVLWVGGKTSLCIAPLLPFWCTRPL